MAKKKEWFAENDFWKNLYPVMFPQHNFKEAIEQVPALMHLAGVQGQRILDLACGPGRFTVPLARAGYQVTGVDRTPYLLEKGRQYARTAKVKIEWVNEDMRTFVRPEAFDLALNLYTSFGYFDDPHEDIQVLRNILASLRPGGVLILDVLGKESLASRFQPVSYDATVPGLELIQRHEPIEDWTRLQNEWILIENERVKRFKFKLRIYSGQELRDRLFKAGFKSVGLCADLEGNPYGLHSKRLIALARKADVPATAPART